MPPTGMGAATVDRTGRTRFEAAPPAQSGIGIYQPLDEETEAARRRYEQYLQERSGIPREIPYVNPSTVARPDDVNPYDAGQIERVTNVERIGPTERVEVGLDSVARGVTSRDVAAPSQPAMLSAAYDRMAGATVQDQQGQQVRGEQMGYIQSLKAAAEGRAPSVAAAQYDQARGDIAQEALGMAGAARGPDAAAARRDAIRAIADQTRRAALDKATLRATEITAARGQLGGTLSDVRGTDTSTAVENARFTQDASGRNQAVGAQTSQFNAGQGNEMTMQTQRLGTDVAVGNADRSLTADTTTATQQNARDLEAARLRAEAATGNADRSFDASATNAAAANRAIETNAAAANRRGEFTASQRDAVATGNVDRRTGVAVGNADRTQDAATGNADRTVQGRQVDDSRDASLRGSTETAAGTAADLAGQRASGRIQEEASKRGAKAQIAGAVIGGVASGVTAAVSAPAKAATSDRRAKTGIESDVRDQDAFLSALSDAYEYSYRDPRDGEGRRHGPMAQDMERSEIGRDIVEPGPGGKKMVNIEELTLALASAVGRLNEKIDAMGGE